MASSVRSLGWYETYCSQSQQGWGNEGGAPERPMAWRRRWLSDRRARDHS